MRPERLTDYMNAVAEYLVSMGWKDDERALCGRIRIDAVSEHRHSRPRRRELGQNRGVGRRRAPCGLRDNNLAANVVDYVVVVVVKKESELDVGHGDGGGEDVENRDWKRKWADGDGQAMTLERA